MKHKMLYHSYPNFEYRSFINYEFLRTPLNPRTSLTMCVILNVVALIGLYRLSSIGYKQVNGMPFWSTRYQRRAAQKEAAEFFFDACEYQNFSILSHYSAF